MIVTHARTTLPIRSDVTHDQIKGAVQAYHKKHLGQSGIHSTHNASARFGAKHEVVDASDKKHPSTLHEVVHVKYDEGPAELQVSSHREMKPKYHKNLVSHLRNSFGTTAHAATASTHTTTDENETAMSKETAAAKSKPAFGKNWAAHAKITDHKYHTIQANRHDRAGFVLEKKFNDKSTPKSESKPLQKRMDNHYDWAYHHRTLATAQKLQSKGGPAEISAVQQGTGDLLEVAAAKPSLKALSDAANEATVKYQKKATDKNLENAYNKHKDAWDAHQAQHAVKPFGNAGYNRMKHHGVSADHYKSLMGKAPRLGQVERAVEHADAYQANHHYERYQHHANQANLMAAKGNKPAAAAHAKKADEHYDLMEHEQRNVGASVETAAAYTGHKEFEASPVGKKLLKLGFKAHPPAESGMMHTWEKGNLSVAHNRSKNGPMENHIIHISDKRTPSYSRKFGEGSGKTALIAYREAHKDYKKRYKAPSAEASVEEAGLFDIFRSKKPKSGKNWGVHARIADPKHHIAEYQAHTKRSNQLFNQALHSKSPAAKEASWAKAHEHLAWADKHYQHALGLHKVKANVDNREDRGSFKAPFLQSNPDSDPVWGQGSPTEFAAAASGHRFAATVSNPNHSAVIMRPEKFQRFINVRNEPDKDKAAARAHKYYTQKGFKVHSVEHHSQLHTARASVEGDSLNGHGSPTEFATTSSKPEFGKNWAAHAEIKDPAYHQAQAELHHAEADKFRTRIRKSLDSKGAAMLIPSARRKAWEAHPLAKKESSHRNWSDVHHEQADRLSSKA